jgi:DNA-binding MarR family transcriptional regulator
MRKQRQSGFLIAKIHQISGRIFTHILKENGVRLNPAQGRIMFVLWREGPMPITRLCQRTSLGKSTLTNMLDRLERDGHVRRVPSREDRRVITIEATEVDEATLRTFVRVSEIITSIAYKGFGNEDIDRFEKYLNAMMNNMVAYETANS